MIAFIGESTTDDADLTDSHGYDAFVRNIARWKRLVLRLSAVGSYKIRIANVCEVIDYSLRFARAAAQGKGRRDLRQVGLHAQQRLARVQRRLAAEEVVGDLRDLLLEDGAEVLDDRRLERGIGAALELGRD